MKKLAIFVSALWVFISTGNAQSWEMLNKQGMELYETGKYAEAVKVYEQALKQAEKEFGKNHANYATACNNLATSYNEQGRYAEAEPLYKEAKEIRAKVLGKDDLDYANSCGSLAGLYRSQGRNSEAEPLYREIEEIYAKVLGDTPLEYVYSLKERAKSYESQGEYSEVESLYKKIKEIYANVLGKDNPDYATACNDLAALYARQGWYLKAEPLYKEVKKIYAKIFGKESPYYANSCNNLAGLYKIQGKYSEAEPLYKEASKILINDIQRSFVWISEEEIEQYLATYKEDFEIYFSYALQAQKPELSAWLLENNLIIKSLLFFSTNQFRRNLEKAQDGMLEITYETWLSLCRAISLANNGFKEIMFEGEFINLQEKKIELEKKKNETEKQLSLLLSKAGISAELTPKPRKWQEIQAKLKRKEALVEITRIKYFDKKWTDSVLYVALIVKKDSKYPEMIVLPNGNEMEKGDIAYYRNMVRFRKQDEASYKVFFEPLRKFLKGIKKVYFSADGVYHQLNLATLYNPATKKFLGEELEIQLISTSRDFLDLGKKQLQKQTQAYKLYLFGYPDFANKSPKVNSKGEDRSLVDVALVSRIDKKQRFFDELSGSVTYLPGTKKEVAGIEQLAKRANYQVETYLAESASEENLKAVVSPSVLHIATHGFFVEIQEQDRNTRTEEQKFFDNPLLRAGLLLAGAEVTLRKEQLPTKENGILTAQEAMNLDLQGTDLVVLSACETGLGEIKNGEGVFGLQRALQEAGARSVLMSLWKVDDAATQEMMTLFYENLLIKKQDKRTAFANAQNTMKQRYKYPYYWGAFVLVGE